MLVLLASTQMFAALQQEPDLSETDEDVLEDTSSQEEHLEDGESEESGIDEDSSGTQDSLPTQEECNEACAEERLMKLKENWKRVPEEVHLEQIAELQRSGRFDSAAQRLDFLVELYGTLEYRYLFVVNVELQEQYEQALVGYAELKKEELSSELKTQVLFREGIVLDDLKRHKQAQDIFKKLLRSKDLQNGDKERINLLLGASFIHSGSSRKGIRKIARSLARLDVTDSTWMRAKGHDALAHELIRRSEEIGFIGSDKKDKKAVAERMELLKRAEVQVIASIQLKEPEFVLNGLVNVADAYVRFYDDLIVAPAPDYLTVNQKKQYSEQLRIEARSLLEKALDYCKKGVIYADQSGWVGLVVDELNERIIYLSQTLDEY